MKSGKVRIIAGEWRSRWLVFPGVEGLRPTPDAVRETVFNWLAPYLPNLRCLDAYAGSGALGFEAVSRGAMSAVLLEKDLTAAKALRKSKKLLDSNKQISVTQCEALAYIATTKRAFDLIFLDPPFVEDELEKACYQIEKHGLIAEAGLIYIEHASDKEWRFFPENWQILKSAQRGGVKYSLYQKT